MQVTKKLPAGEAHRRYREAYNWLISLAPSESEKAVLEEMLVVEFLAPPANNGEGTVSVASEFLLHLHSMRAQFVLLWIWN